MSLLISLFYIVFVLSAVVLIVVVLLQEGKGGGFGQALGEHGQQTFGVGAKGINTFTGYTAGVFLFSALFLHIMTRNQEAGSVLDGEGSVLTTSPGDAGSGGGLPVGGAPVEGN